MIINLLYKFICRVLTCVAITSTMAISAANATIYYVATNGSDSNPGTNSQPLRTIAKGVKTLSAGDTLYVKSGTYEETILTSAMVIPNGTSWNNPITVAANPGDIVTIKPPTDRAFFWILDGQSKFLIIKGFIIDGVNRARHGVKFEGGTKYVRVMDCEIKNTTDSGILVTNGNSTSPDRINTYHEFKNLKVHHTGSTEHAASGFYIETGYNLVESSEFYNNKANGGKFFHGNLSGVANNNIARNNKFYNNSTAGVWSCGLLMSSGNGNLGYNNIAYGNFAGFCLQSRVTNGRFYNNIAYENDVYGFYVGFSTTSGSRIENNSVYNNGTYGIFVGDSATSSIVKNNIAYANNIDLGLTNTTSSHNETENPSFVNIAGKDFHLQSNSPAIDKGTTISGISTDFGGQPRPKGAQFDIGAYEYQGTGSTSTGGSTTGGTTSSSTTTTTTSIFPPPLASPSPGTTLTTSSVTFTGAHTSQDLEHLLRVGTTPGGSDLFNQKLGSSHSATVSGLPTSGTLYVGWWTRNSSGWFVNNSTFTMKR